MNCTYKLKWLNGPLSGRELAIPDGELHLGGEGSDVDLRLEKGAAAVLLIDDTAVKLISDTPTWVDGRQWSLEQPLPTESVIDIAGQAFVIGLFDAELAVRGVPERLDSVRQGHSRWTIYCGVVLLISALLVGTLMFFRSVSTEVSSDLDDWLAALLDDQELSGLAVQRDKDGNVSLKGRCNSSISVEGLKLRLIGKGLNLYDESVCVDTLLANVKTILTLNGYRDVVVKSGDLPYQVVIFGNIVADPVWQRTSMQLRGIQALEGWTVVNDQAHLFKNLLDRLVTRNLLQGLSIKVEGSILGVSGQLDPRRLVKVQQVLDEFNHEGTPRLFASFQNIPGAALLSGYLPSVIVSVGGNKDQPYIQLANGMRLQRGSVLQSGYLVYALSRSAIVLLKEQDLITMPLDV